MKRLLNTILAPFAWKAVKETSHYVYEENRVTGERRVRLGLWRGGHVPTDKQWLRGGAFTARVRTPASGDHA